MTQVVFEYVQPGKRAKPCMECVSNIEENDVLPYPELDVGTRRRGGKR
jgi:uncharacterized cupin superfamily protein